MTHDLLAIYKMSDYARILPLIEALRQSGISVYMSENDREISTEDIMTVKGVIVFLTDEYLRCGTAENDLDKLSSRQLQQPVILVWAGDNPVQIKEKLFINAPLGRGVKVLQEFASSVVEMLSASGVTEFSENVFHMNTGFHYRTIGYVDSEKKKSHSIANSASVSSSYDNSGADVASNGIGCIDVDEDIGEIDTDSFTFAESNAPDASIETTAQFALSQDTDVFNEPKQVILGASAPQEVMPGEEFIANFLAYIPELEKVVQEIVEKQSPRTATRFGLEKCCWKKGTRVKVKLSADSFSIDSPVEEFEWDGEYKILAFDVSVPSISKIGSVMLKFDVYIAETRIAKLLVEMVVNKKVSSKSKVTVTGKPASTAFASYASEDRPRVSDRVSALKIGAGMDVFIDCLSMQASEEWKPRLEKEIADRDLFLLFWSKEAEKSEWVTWEWQTALEIHNRMNRPDFNIQPLENGIIPPKELSHLHFNDPLMAIREEAVRSKIP